MSNSHDELDSDGYADRDRLRDDVRTGPAADQIRRAEQLLGRFNAPTYIEKRNLAEDFRPGSLQPMNRSFEPVTILVSIHPVGGSKHHVVLSRNELREMRAAEITTRRAGQLQSMVGRLQPGPHSRRAEDRQAGTSMVSYFYPVD